MKIISYFPLDKKCEEYICEMGEYTCLEGHKYCVEDLKDADIIIGNVPAVLLKECKKLSYLQLIYAGSDGYINYVNDQFAICNASGTFGAGIAEHLLMYTLMFFRNMLHYEKMHKKHCYYPLKSNKTIHGSTFLICGCGDIGTQFAKRIKALGGYTIGIKRRSVDALPFFDEVYTDDCFEKNASRADVVALCLPRNDSTNLFLNEARINLLKEDAIVLNVGRGNAIDHNALMDALTNHKIFGAGLDVFEKEPLSEEHPLWDCENVIITPHVSGTFANAYTYELFYDLLYENLKLYREGKNLKNRIDPVYGYRIQVE